MEMLKRRAMLFYNILSQIFIVKCFTKSLLIRIFVELKKSKVIDLVCTDSMRVWLAL